MARLCHILPKWLAKLLHTQLQYLFRFYLRMKANLVQRFCDSVVQIKNERDLIFDRLPLVAFQRKKVLLM